MEIPILKDLVIIFSLSIGVILCFHRFQVPAIMGFLLTGILAGPHVLGLVHEEHIVEVMAEIGIVLLLFTIGIEFSIGHLLRLKKPVLLGGGLQVGLSIAVGSGAALGLGYFFPQALFWGFLLSLSSTAIVLKILQDQGQIETPFGRMLLAILIFQDVAAIPMMLAAPKLAGVSSGAEGNGFWIVAQALGLICFLFWAARFGVPFLLAQIVKTRIRELFLLGIVTLGFGIALISSSIGLSLALGAFIAGMIISESEYSHQAMGYVLPFKDIFTSLFFVSIGMLLNLEVFLEHVGLIILLLLAAIGIKFLMATLATLAVGHSLRIALVVGLSLAQIGEFSLVVSKLGLKYELLNPESYQIFLAVSILSMLAVPLLMKLSHPLAQGIQNIKPLAERESKKTGPLEQKQDHLIIVGFGLGGRVLVKAAQKIDIPYTILESNLDTVMRERAKGLPIVYGDATQIPVLEHIGIHQARSMIVVISDAAATRRVIQVARQLNAQMSLIVRTRYEAELPALYQLGANHVISEEFETAIEILVQMLRNHFISRSVIDELVYEVRQNAYQMLRTPAQRDSDHWEVLSRQLPQANIFSFKLPASHPLVGSTLQDFQLRQNFHLTLLALQRNGETWPHPSADTEFRAHDVIFLMGKSKALRRFESLKKEA